MLMPLVIRVVSMFSAFSLRSSLRPARMKALGLSAFLALLACLAPAAHATTFTVNSVGDTGTGTGNSGDLRYAITQANAASGSSIQFAVTGTITLTSALPQITTNVSITGSGPAVLTISGAGSYPVFSIGSGGTVTINGMTIANASGGNGGGISSAGTLTVENVAFTGNIASGSGGAIYSSGTLTVDTGAFSGNGSESFGGAIYGTGNGVTTISNSTFSDNRSTYGGAIATGVSNGGALPITVTNSTFSRNTSVSSGGGITIFCCNFTLTNSTFSGNSSGNGGGLYDSTFTTTANNNIFTGNFAYTDGGIYNHGTLNGDNNILGGDINVSECGGTGTGCFTNGVSGNQVGVSVSSIGLLPLGNYGGATETMALLPGSVAICAGLRADAIDANSNPLAFDERGFAMDATCSSGSVDAGAVQTNQYVVNSLMDTGDGSDNCNPIGTGTTCSLRDAIGDANSSGGDVTFLPSLTSVGTPGTINLSSVAIPAGTGTGLTLGRGNILGPGANQLTVAGDDFSSVGSVLTVTSGGQVFLYGLTIAQGYTESSPGGGGINNLGTLTVMASAISSSQTDSGLSGGGIANSGTLTLTGSTVSGNQLISGSGSGGGIYSTGTLTLNESTVAGNSVSFQSTGGGGGIFVAVGSLTLTGSTVSGNTAAQICPGGPSCLGGNGGGIYNGGTLTAENSIVAGNTTMGTANSGDCVNCGSPDSTNQIGGIPELSGLLSNGIGATIPTMIPLPGSPAICAGLAGNLPSWISTDERGYSLYPTGGYCALGVVDSGAVQTNYTGVQFVQQPTTTIMGSDISPAPSVAILETDTLLSTNNTDAVNGVPISLTYSDGASNLITGTLTQTTAGGVATYGDLAPGAGPASAVLSTSVPVYGSVTLTATSDSFTVIGPASRFVITTSGAITAGTPSQYTVTAQDESNNVAIGYSGTPAITSSDTASGVVLPASCTIVNGVGTFTATLITGGYQTVTATDAANSLIGQTNFYVDAAAPVSLSVTQYPTSWYAGATAQVFITANDQYGNPETPFTGPVTVTTSDSAATITQFTPYENGIVAYSVVFGTQGPQTISASSAGLTGGSETGITIGPMPSFVVTLATDTTDGQDTASDCTNQSLAGATPDASCSLRDAVWSADYLGAGNVTFSPSVFGVATTITLTAPQNSGADFGSLPVGANITLTGPTGSGGSVNLVTVSGATPAAPSTGSAVFFVYGTPYTLDLFGPDTISNLNITNGDGSAATGDNSGTGGISSQAPTFTLTNCNLTGNTGDFAGALYNYSGQMTVTGGSFSNNTTTGVYEPDAGAIFSDTSTSTPPFVKEHPFASRRNGEPLPIVEASNSTARPKSAFYGTAIGGRTGFARRVRPMNPHKASAHCAGCATMRPGNASMLTSHLSAVPEASPGGSPYFGPTLTVSNTTFTGNQGSATGAVFDAGDLVSITNSTFANNTASDGGGALGVFEFGGTTVSGSTFTGNSGSVAGVAFVVDGGELQMQGSTLAQNLSTGGGGIPIPDAGGITVVADSYAFLAYDTLINNSSTSGSGIGAIGDIGSSNSYVAAFNLTVTGNSGFYGAMLDDSSFESDLENTIAAGNTTTDPTAATDGISPDSNGMVQYGRNVITPPHTNLSLPGNYGGPTQTMLPIPGSQAICGGSETGYMANALANYGVSLTSDQRGFPNVNTAYNDPKGVCVDAGAVQTYYSVQFTTQPPADAAVNAPMAPGPTVGLFESGFPLSLSSGSVVTMTDTTGQLAGTVSEGIHAGLAVFNKLIVPVLSSGDTLTATLVLHSSVTTQAQATTSINVEGAVAATVSPSSGSLPSSQLFTWNNGVGPVNFDFELGTAGEGSTDLYLSHVTTATSATVSIPSNGVTVYGTLRQFINGAWQVTRYTFTEPGTPTPATLTPSSGTISGSTTFTWNNGAGPTKYELLLGTTGLNTSDIYSSGTTTDTSETVSIPSSGLTVYATLKQLISGTWQYSHYTFTETGTPIPATLTPSSGTLSTSQLFDWSNGTGPVDFVFELGTTGAGSTDLYNSGLTTATSTTISIPSNGVKVYATLRQLINGTWQVTRYTFTEP